MPECRQVTIHNEGDLINARLYTRQMAKEAGLPTVDQARISLAVTSLAHILHLGDSYSGQVLINPVATGGRGGVEVVWIVEAEEGSEEILNGLNASAVTMMVDEINIQSSPETGLRISAIKWAPANTGF